MKRIFCFLLRMSLPWLFVYLWLDYEAEGAFNVLAFYICALFPLVLLMLVGSVKPSEKVLKMKPLPRIFTLIDTVLDLVLMLLLAWQGHFVLVVLTAVTTLLRAMAGLLIKEARAKAAAAA
jgi:hypothetical protein